MNSLFLSFPIFNQLVFETAKHNQVEKSYIFSQIQKIAAKRSLQHCFRKNKMFVAGKSSWFSIILILEGIKGFCLSKNMANQVATFISCSNQGGTLNVIPFLATENDSRYMSNYKKHQRLKR